MQSFAMCIIWMSIYCTLDALPQHMHGDKVCNHDAMKPPNYLEYGVIWGKNGVIGVLSQIWSEVSTSPHGMQHSVNT